MNAKTAKLINRAAREYGKVRSDWIEDPMKRAMARAKYEDSFRRDAKSVLRQARRDERRKIKRELEDIAHG